MSADSTEPKPNTSPKKEFYRIKPVYNKDDSPEGEYEAVRLSQAKTSLYMDLPFFGWILAQMEIFPTRDVPTYAADTRRLYINPLFTQDKPKARLKGLLLHLVLHLILKHGKNMENKDGNIWGISTDVSTNLIANETYENYARNSYEKNLSWDIDKIDKIPEFIQNSPSEKVYSILYEYAESLRGIEDPGRMNIFKKEGSYTEYFSNEVYEEVREYSGVDNPCYFSKTMHLYYDGMGEGTADLEEQRINGLIRGAYQNSRRKGDLPNSIKEIVESIVSPKIPWYTELEHYIQKTIMSDWSWTPPNRRMVGMGVYLPATKKEHIEVVIAIDTSGSISSEELSAFAKEAYSIVSTLGNVKMHFVDCDAQIQQVLVIESGESLDGSQLPWEGRPFKGRGGTSFIPVFDWVEENQIQPDILIYFTDGYGNFPRSEPVYPTMWVMTTDIDPPFGEVIRYELTE